MELVERLAQHRLLGSAPREELAWLAEHGVLRSLAVGDVLSHKGQPVEGMYPVLSGRLAIFVDRGAGPQRMIEWRGGEVGADVPQLKNRQAAAAPRLDGSTPSPLRRAEASVLSVSRSRRAACLHVEKLRPAPLTR